MKIFTQLLATLLFFVGLQLSAQNPTSLPGPITVCPAGEFSGHHFVPMPQWLQENLQHAQEAKAAGTSCGSINVEYIGFSPDAQAAFQAAVDIWEASLTTTIDIEVEAHWTVLGEGVLGSAGPNTIWTSFSGAPQSHYYPSALADQLHGSDLDPNEPDIVANFNSDFDWYLGTDGNPPNDQFDLLSVVLHELGHGLGFISSKDYDNGEGSLGLSGTPYTYDTYLTLGSGGGLLLDISDPTDLGDAFTSNNVYSNSPGATDALSGVFPRHYAPADYAPGSSISHWNESTFGAGNINSLMTPQIGPGEAILDPGPITLGLFEDIGWVLCGGTVNPCLAQDLSLEGPAEICPPETTEVDLVASNVVPADGGAGIRFNNNVDVDILLYGVSFPYSFDNDLNGVLSANNIDPFAGAFELSTFVYSDSDDPTGTICSESSNPVNVNFLTEDDPGCSGNPCSAEDLTLTGPSGICPGETTSVELVSPNSIPTGGGQGVRFNNGVDVNIILYGITFPYSFDNDLNGVLSANDFDPFVGEFELNTFVYSDPNDVGNSICDESDVFAVVNFLAEDDPACNIDPCVAENLELTGPDAICPGETTSVDIVSANSIPDGGGQGIRFNNGVDINITLYGIDFPYEFDNDLNGVLSANDFDPFVGEFELNTFVFTDPDDVQNTICSESSETITINFRAPDDPVCNPCQAENLLVNGPSEICPGETTEVQLSAANTIPSGGGAGIRFNNGAGINLTLSNVTFPYSFDNDLNGVLSANDIDPFEGSFELNTIVYSDPNNVTNSICSESSETVSINFLTEADAPCVPQPCLEWQSPDPGAGWSDFNDQFGGAPCDPGTGCPVFEITTFQVWAGEAYAMDNIQAGGTYTFSMCNGPGAGSWVPDFTILSPGNTVDAFGPGNGCSISWTASESGTYLIVINEAGNCGGTNQVDNGYPSITCEGDNVPCPIECNAGELEAQNGNTLCPGLSAPILNTDGLAGVAFPTEGGYRMRVEIGANTYFMETIDPQFGFVIDNDLFGIVSGQGDDPLVGMATLSVETYNDSGDPEGSICDTSEDLSFEFLEETDPACVTSVAEFIGENGWNLFPNPANDQVSVQFNCKQSGNLKIYLVDLQGRKIQTQNTPVSTGKVNIEMDISSIASGYYRIILSMDGSQESKPLIISGE